MTGEDREWIATTTEYMESNYGISGAFTDRDFIGGRPTLDQITEFVYTCKKTIVEFHSGSEWRNYTARMVIQRMFAENLEQSKERLIIVVRDEEADNRVPQFLACHFRLKSSDPDFHWKLYNSVLGLSLANRKRLERQSVGREQQELFPGGNHGGDEMLLPREPGSRGNHQETARNPDSGDRFIPESHPHDPLEQQPGNTPQQYSSVSSGSTSGDGDSEQPRDRFLSEDDGSGVFSPIQPDSVISSSRNSERSQSNTNRVENGGLPREDIRDSAYSEPSTVNSGLTTLVDQHQPRSGEHYDIPHENGDISVKALEGNSNSNGPVSNGTPSEISDTESAQMATIGSSSSGPESDQVDTKQDNPAKARGETLLKELMEYAARHASLNKTEQISMSMSPMEYKNHQQAMSNLGKDAQYLISGILKGCAETAGLQLDSSVEYNTAQFRKFLQDKEYLSPSLDQKLKMLKLEGAGNSTMSETVLQVPNVVIAGLCMNDLKKLVEKAFEIKA
ncbi:uncharacterized protein [Ptychodera flava]|uniref:uncharacterized protein n=1 Tax=Ptychodera flava TaxID=63121 RepID=UPI00396A3380